MAETERTCSSVPDHPLTESYIMSEAAKKEECSTDNETPTPYMEMCTQANKVPSIYNILAALFSWLTLAGFVVLPGTFTSLKHSTTLSSSKGGEIVQKTVQNVPLQWQESCVALGLLERVGSGRNGARSMFG
jgi:hypothetical protein